jgi:hypothetical protein
MLPMPVASPMMTLKDSPSLALTHHRFRFYNLAGPAFHCFIFQADITILFQSK